MATLDNRFAGGPGYKPLDDIGLRRLLSGLDQPRAILGGGPESWSVEEVGDGNLNLVFIVRGAAGGVVVKQALPYVRLVGESWPLPLDRAHFEALALAEHNRLAPGLVPRLFHYDAGLAACVMEYLSPHIILRRGLIDGRHYPHFATAITAFMAQTLYGTSALALPGPETRRLAEAFNANTALCEITEDLVFTDPYRLHDRNHWTSPQLDPVAAALRQDSTLKRAAQELKHRFLTAGEALIHGDLHTGSIMVTATDTRAIDPEFAITGPIGFDVGAVLGNLLLAWAAQPGQATATDDRVAQADWLLATVEAVWTGFAARFLDLWRAEDMAGTRRGAAFAADLFTGPDDATALEAARQQVIASIFADTLGFAGAKMIRRIVGLAHVADMDSIQDADRRAACETRAVAIGRALILNRASLSGIAEVTALVRDIGQHR